MTTPYQAPVLHAELVPQERLSAVLATRTLAPAEVLGYAASVAESLAQWHERGQAHGAVQARNVLLHGHDARLTPPTRDSAASVADDILQFALLVRSMLAVARPHPGGLGGESYQTALERILVEYQQPGAARSKVQLRKAAMAIKLLRIGLQHSAAGVMAPQSDRPESAAQAPPEIPEPRALATLPFPAAARPRKLLLLVRAVPAAQYPESAPQSSWLATLPWIGLASALGLAVGIWSVLLLSR